jgi:hypothetical protein
MRRFVLFSVALLLFSALPLHADVVVLRDGRSYFGTYTGQPGGTLVFKGASGIQYSFPLSQVQTIVFSSQSVHLSLLNGQTHTGQWVGVTGIRFAGANGTSYVFPVKDVSSLVLTHGQSAGTAPAIGQQMPAGAAAAGQTAPVNVPPVPNGATGQSAMASTAAGQSLVIPSGTQISVLTNTAIDTRTDPIGKLYPAQIQSAVVDSTGAVVIPAGSAAQLHVVNLKQAGTQNSNPNAKDLALDLYSVSVNGKVYHVNGASMTQNGKAGYGMNKRTAAYTGGGAALGAVMGAIFGGGKGAAVGTLAGGALGATAQYLTRGREVVVPAESMLTFQLGKAMVLQP